MAWWIPLITAAAGAAKGYGNQKQQKKNDEFRKAAIRYSPWTGMQDPGAQNAGQGVLGSAIQGGITGALAAQSFGGAGAAGAGAGAGASGVGAGGLALNTAAPQATMLNHSTGALGAGALGGAGGAGQQDLYRQLMGMYA